MAINFNERLKKILGKDESGERTQKTAEKVNRLYGKGEYNPFLDRNGKVFNKYIDYQRVLNNPNISQNAKQYISDATGLVPTQNTSTKVRSNNVVVPAVSFTGEMPKSDSGIVETAKKYIGTPYVWGGESMAEGGMDCSGFVYNALKDAGKNVGRTTAEGYRSGGTAVPKSNMQPGDLVFFGKNGKATHIGIYMGDGKMIHSSGGSSNTKSNPGKGVSIANVDYRSDFLEARRY